MPNIQTLLTRALSLVAILILAGCAGLSGTADRDGALDSSQTIDLTIPAPDAWERIRRGFAIPNLNTPLVDKWTAYYARHPESMNRMANRAGKYLYYIVEEINRRGLPTELALLPFVESAYNPIAYSHANASGLWQFIPSTGTQFKLKQDWWHDQRRDPIASTNAALDYLEYLFEFQGDWYLALASYNWGEGAVQRAVKRNEAAGKRTDYLSLNMPAETQNYLPKLQAIKNIVADPKKYGVVLPDVNNSPYFVAIKKTVNIDYVLAAKFAEMPLEDFQALNPSFNQPIIAAKEDHSIILPRDRVAIYNKNFAQYRGDLTSWKTYEAQDGESISAIASKFGVPEGRLRQANRLPTNVRVTGATTLIIPGPSGEGIRLNPADKTSLARAGSGGTASTRVTKAPARAPVASPARAVTNTASANTTLRLHTVRAGDTLSSIAKQYGTSAASIRTLNNLKSDTLRAGAKLRIPSAVSSN
ncbi:MAG: transglycosylase SLT domain-containing protein [Burkholderiaceae bacterium]|nr:transglycosylase SLT domain-containing protein [Burkholderiaceae bacterium]